MKPSDSFFRKQIKTTHLSLDNLHAVFYLRTAFSDTAPPPRPTNAHEHAWYEVHCVKKGWVTIEADQKIITVKSNELLFLPPRTYHITKSSDAQTLRVCIGFELFHNGKSPKENLYASLAQPFAIFPCVKLTGCSALANLSCELAAYLQNGGEIDHCRSHAMLTNFLFLLFDKLVPPDKLHQNNANLKPAFHSPDQINYLLDHLTSNQINNLSLQEMSEKLYLSKKQINSMVKKRYHTTYKQKQIRFRMENAKKLLTETSVPVESVARQVGYSNLTSFYKAFRNMTGVTPASYRKSHTAKSVTP